MNDLVLHVPSVPINAFKCIFSIEGKVIKQHLQTSLNNAQMEIKDYLNYTAKSKAESAN